jgi:predicted ferric reductase
VTTRRTGSYVLAAAVLFPLVPWLTAGSVADRFSGIAILTSVANLAALFGIAAWAANLVLASRIRPVERALGGLEHLYRLHRRVGVLVVILAATHVLFLTLHEAGDALDLYVPAAGWATFSGMIAFVLLVGFVVTSLVGRLDYQTFLLVQQLLGVAFILGALHTFAVHGTLDSSPVLTVYLACLTAMGIASLGYRLIGGPAGIGVTVTAWRRSAVSMTTPSRSSWRPPDVPWPFSPGSSCTPRSTRAESPGSLTPSRLRARRAMVRFASP